MGCAAKSINERSETVIVFTSWQQRFIKGGFEPFVSVTDLGERAHKVGGGGVLFHPENHRPQWTPVATRPALPRGVSHKERVLTMILDLLIIVTHKSGLKHNESKIFKTFLFDHTDYNS